MARLYAWIAGALAILAALLGVRQSGARAERERQEARRQAEHAEATGHRNDILTATQDRRDEIDAMPDGDVADRLRDRWTREDH